jgi:hypothetical protein
VAPTWSMWLRRKGARQRLVAGTANPAVERPDPAMTGVESGRAGGGGTGAGADQ